MEKPSPHPCEPKSPLPAFSSVASGDSLPFVGPEPHPVAPLKTPVAPRGRLKSRAAPCRR